MESALWYEQIRDSLATQFADVLEAEIELIRRQPLAYPLLGRRGLLRTVRRKVVSDTFQHNIYYTVDEDARKVVVVAVWHQRRSLRGLRARLK